MALLPRDAAWLAAGHDDFRTFPNTARRWAAGRVAVPVYALPGALDAVLALDRPGMLAAGYDLREFAIELG